MRLKRHLTGAAGATLLCAGTVVASVVLGFALRPGQVKGPGVPSWTPAEVAAFEPLMPETIFAESETERPVRAVEAGPVAPALAERLPWLRPALSEEAFTARFESPSPALAFAALEGSLAGAMPFAEPPAAGEAIAPIAPPSVSPGLLAVRPPTRPVFPRAKLASLDPALAISGLGEPAEPASPDASALAAAPSPFGSWSDPFGRSARQAATPAGESGRPLQTGVASWYGPRFHGRRTASGEIFNQYDLTAAHRRLPFGTRVKVVNETTGQSVVVRINDRGPFSHGRVIDLSKASAQAVGLNGIGRVKIVSADD